MRIRRICACRGEGKAYIEFAVSGGEKPLDLAARAKTKEGNAVPCWLFRAGENDDRVFFVLTIPIAAMPIYIVLSERMANGDVAECYEMTARPSTLKWISRLNYRLKAAECAKIRNIDRADSLIQPIIEPHLAIPGERSETVRTTILISSFDEDLDYSEYVANIAFLDSGFRPLAVENKVFLGASRHETPTSGEAFVSTEIEFSFKVPYEQGEYTMVLPPLSEEGGGYYTFDIVEQRRLREDFRRMTLSAAENPEYPEWLNAHRPNILELERQRTAANSLAYSPLFSIVVSLRDASDDVPEETLASILAQTYGNYEVILVNTCPGSQELQRKFEAAGFRDRLKIVELDENETASRGLDEGIRAAAGDYMCFLDCGDALEPQALSEYVSALNADPSIDMFYSDEDEILPDGSYRAPAFKPDFSEYLLRETNYMWHFLAIRRSLALQAYAYDPRFDGAQDYKLVLDCTAGAQAVRHVPKVLYHQRGAGRPAASESQSTPSTDGAGQAAVSEYLQKRGIEAIVHKTKAARRYSVEYVPSGNPLISIVIPNKDNAEVLTTCVDALYDRSTYRDFEVVVVENNSVERRTFDCYDRLKAQHESLKVVTWEGEFNYSAINNYGVSESRGDYLLFLNNDTEVIAPGWLGEMLGICQDEKVGAVGARLLYPDDTIQHAGVYVQGKAAGHLHLNLDKADAGYLGFAATTREVSACSAACLMTRKPTFNAVGGFEERFVVAYNDVDYCMKVRDAGYSVVYTPRAVLYHYESLSRGHETTAEKRIRFHREAALLNYRWARQYVEGDPYMSPNLSSGSPYYALPFLNDKS